MNKTPSAPGCLRNHHYCERGQYLEPQWKKQTHRAQGWGIKQIVLRCMCWQANGIGKV